MKSRSALNGLTHTPILILAMLGAAVGTATAAEAAASGDRLDFSAMGISIRMPTNKVTWAVTDTFPARAAVVRRARHTHPPFAVRELLAALGVSGTGNFDLMNGRSEWQTTAGPHRVYYALADGAFYYSFDDATPEWDLPEPPEFDVVQNRLVGLLVRSGFPTNELMVSRSVQLRVGRSEGETSSWNPEKKARFTKRSSRGVSFSRQVGGVPEQGVDSVAQLEYRGDSIQSLRIQWPALEVVKEHPVAGRNQLLQWLAEGRCAIDDFETTGMRHVEIREIQAIKITSARMQYWRDWNVDQDQEMGQLWFPMLVLEVELTLGPDDIETTSILSPAIDAGLPPKARSDPRSFGIFPSKRFPLPDGF